MKKRGAFTLIELLVVISVIALLLALLMPAWIFGDTILISPSSLAFGWAFSCVSINYTRDGTINQAQTCFILDRIASIILLLFSSECSIIRLDIDY
ncbi:type II secretion system protein [Planctomycetota bacterium]